jgi:ParB family chromosome partitioning protein
MPAVVRRYSESQIKEIALIENLQREDLNPIEAAMGIKQLMDEYKCTQEAVAERIGKSRPAVTNYLRLLTLTDPVIELVKQNRLSAGHAKCLVSVTDPDAQLKFAKSASDGKMSVRDIEKAVRVYLNPEKYAKKNPPISIELRELINDMQHVFATKVKAIGNDRKGRIYIDYYTKDDLDRIHTLIARIKK